MSDNVITLPVVSRLNSDPSRVIEDAIKAELTDIVICGYTKDGVEYFASSIADGADVLWLLERLKFQLMCASDTEDHP